MKQIFINLPVKDLSASLRFYESLGFQVNPLFTFDNQKCVVWGEQISLMLQSYEMFEAGNKKKFGSPRESTNVTFTLPVHSVEEVDIMVANGLKAGGLEISPARHEAFMVVRNIEDPDGYTWGIICIDLPKFKELMNR